MGRSGSGAAGRGAGWTRAVGVALGVSALVVVAAVGAGALGSASPEKGPAAATPAATTGATAAAEQAEPAEQADQAEPSEKAEPSEAGDDAAATPPSRARAAEATAGNGRGLGRSAGSTQPVTCESARNHGEYVSSIARSTPAGPDKDAIVAAAAQRDCGKRARPPDDDPGE